VASAARSFSRREGNPFFIEEMMRALFDEGAIVCNGEVRVARPLSQVRLPPTVQGILASRIDRLPAAHKELLETLAVMGRESSLALIRSVAMRPDGELEPQQPGCLFRRAALELAKIAAFSSDNAMAQYAEFRKRQDEGNEEAAKQSRLPQADLGQADP
jgi:hypothetical protein